MASKVAMEDIKKSNTSSETKKQQKKKYKKNAWEQIDIESEKQKDPKYKTEICAAFQENGFCPYGNRCRFAHGKSELFIKDINHPNYKRKDCLSFHMHGFCTYGVRCHFKHSAEFDKIPRSFFQLILMVYAFENLSAKEIHNYFFSEDEEKKEGTDLLKCCFLKQGENGFFESLINFEKKTDEAMNSQIIANRERTCSDSGGESFQSPVKSNTYALNGKSKIHLLDHVYSSGEKISYTYNPNKRANKADILGLKSKSSLLYKKRLSIFQNISQMHNLRKKFPYNVYYGQNNDLNKIDGVNKPSCIDLSLNYNWPSNVNYFDIFNETSVSTLDKIQKNFEELIISSKSSSKVFIPKEYRNNEGPASFTANSDKYQTEKPNLLFANNTNNNDNFDIIYKEAANYFTKNFQYDNPSNSNFIAFNNFINEDNYSKCSFPNELCDSTSFLPEENIIDFASTSNVNSNNKLYNIFNNGFSKNLENLQYKFKCNYIKNDNLSQNFISNSNEKTVKIKQSIVNSEKSYKHVNILESDFISAMNDSHNNNNSHNKSHIVNSNKNNNYNYFRLNSYQKNLNYCKYDERNLVNRNLDFSLCDSKTTCDNFDNFNNENFSNIENLDYNCISPKASFDLNDDPIYIIKTLSFNTDDKKSN